MAILENVFLLLGGIATFLMGLKSMSDNLGEVVGSKMTKAIRACTKNRVSALMVGGAVTAVLQSSIATNMIAITFVEKGILSFYTVCAVILGTNVGTTITAQLVSLSTISDFEISLVGCLIAFIGFLLTLFRGERTKKTGCAIFGFGLIFIGLRLMTESVECFKNYAFFTRLFLVKSPPILLLNGILITCIVQSSSVVTSVLILLASVGLIDFYSALFIVLGANIGTCFPVIFSSLNLSMESKKAATFNLVFNVFGTAIFFLILVLFPDFMQRALTFSSTSIGRNVANFHTVFNLAVSIILLPVLKPFCKIVEKFCEYLYSNQSSIKAKNMRNSRAVEARIKEGSVKNKTSLKSVN